MMRMALIPHTEIFVRESGLWNAPKVTSSGTKVISFELLADRKPVPWIFALGQPMKVSQPQTGAPDGGRTIEP